MDPKILAEIQRLRKQTTVEIGKGTFNALICGGVGTGKSTMLRTAVKPVFVFQFDPGGVDKLRMLQDYVKKGEIIIDNQYAQESMSNPTAFKNFQLKFDEYKRIKFFDSIGTVCIDSFTTWWKSIYNVVVRTHNVEKNCMSQPGYQIAGHTVIDFVKLFTALPCNFILNSHLDLTKDEVEGRMIARFKSIPSLKIDVPLLFDEIYVTQTKESNKGIDYTLLTQSTGRYEARTRIGGGVFDQSEPQDIKALMKKAGLDIKDKPIPK